MLAASSSRSPRLGSCPCARRKMNCVVLCRASEACCTLQRCTRLGNQVHRKGPLNSHASGLDVQHPPGRPEHCCAWICSDVETSVPLWDDLFHQTCGRPSLHSTTAAVGTCTAFNRQLASTILRVQFCKYISETIAMGLHSPPQFYSGLSTWVGQVSPQLLLGMALLLAREGPACLGDVNLHHIIFFFSVGTHILKSRSPPCEPLRPTAQSAYGQSSAFSTRNHLHGNIVFADQSAHQMKALSTNRGDISALADSLQ